MDNYTDKVFNAACKLNEALNDFKYLATLPADHPEKSNLTIEAFTEYDALASLCSEYLRNYYYYATSHCEELLDTIDSDARFPIEYDKIKFNK